MAINHAICLINDMTKKQQQYEAKMQQIMKGRTFFDELSEQEQKEFARVAAASFFDPRNPNVYYRTPEEARGAAEIAQRLEAKSVEEFIQGDNAYRWTKEKLPGQIPNPESFNGKVSLGKIRGGQDYVVDFAHDHLAFTILTGSTGTGKGVLHNHIYKTLMSQNDPQHLAFVFMDMTRVDFGGWKTHLFCPVIYDSYEALTYLSSLGELSDKRASGKADNKQAIFVHIEECDMIAKNPTRFETAIEAIVRGKSNNNMYVVFSSSRPSTNVFTPKLIQLADMRIVYQLASSRDYKHVAGRDLSKEIGEVGEHTVVRGDEIKFLAPFPETYVKTIVDEYLS